MTSLKVLTFTYNDRPLRIAKFENSSTIYLFKEDFTLIIVDSLKSLSHDLSNRIINDFFGSFIRSQDIKSCFYENKIHPLVDWRSIVELFETLNFEQDALELVPIYKNVANDIELTQKFIIKAHSKAVKKLIA